MRGILQQVAGKPANYIIEYRIDYLAHTTPEINRKKKTTNRLRDLQRVQKHLGTPL